MCDNDSNDIIILKVMIGKNEEMPYLLPQIIVVIARARARAWHVMSVVTRRRVCLLHVCPCYTCAIVFPCVTFYTRYSDRIRVDARKYRSIIFFLRSFTLAG